MYGQADYFVVRPSQERKGGRAVNLGLARRAVACDHIFIPDELGVLTVDYVFQCLKRTFASMRFIANLSKKMK
jgi:hypothetical protein